MVEQALQTLQEADTYAAIEFLNQQPGPTAVGDAYVAVVKDLYWQQHNIDQVLAMSRAGIQYCSDQAQIAAADDDMALAYDLRSHAKTMAYNIASYTWPGWDVPEIKLTALHTEAGFDGARMNLRLALELDKGDIRISRAYWMLAAHLLTEKLVAGAEAIFRRAALYAERAEAADETLLNLGFAALAAVLRDPDDEEALAAYVTAKEALLAVEHGPDFVDQIETAERVVKSNG